MLDEAVLRERWSNHEGEDDPFVKLVNMFLVTMAKAKATTLRVRSDAEPVVQLHGASGWTTLDDMPDPPANIREPLVWRLKFMSEIAVDATFTFGAKLRVVFGRRAADWHDFDVCYSRSASGSSIVVSRVPTIFGVRSNPEVSRRASILLSQAEEASSREETLARVREAVSLVPESDGWRIRALCAGAVTCHDAGLFDEAISLVNLALPHAEDARDRAYLEHVTAVVHDQRGELDEAVAAYARSIAAAETLNRPHVHAAAPLGSLADVEMERGDFDAAERHLARAEAILSDTFGVESSAFLDSRVTRAKLLRLRGVAVAAEAMVTAAFASATRFRRADCLVSIQDELAELSLARGDARAAIPHLRAILQMPSRHPLRARVYTMLARALRSLGSDAEALSALRAAAALVDVLAHDHPIRQDIERELAQLTAASPYR